MMIDKKGFKSFYDEVGFKKQAMKADFLYACGIYRVEDLRYAMDYEREEAKKKAKYYTDSTAYYKKDSISFFRFLFTPLCILSLLILWAFQLIFIVCTFPLILLLNMKLEI
jgi:hypothetical protein